MFLHLPEDMVGDFDVAIDRLNRRRAALDAEITALPADDPQRTKLRSKLRKLDAQIEALEETDEDELTDKDRRMARLIAEELSNVQKEADAALKEGENKEGENKEGENKEGENKEGESKEGENKEGNKEDSDPAPEHSWFRERGRK